jgi:hypothetical protein
MASLVRNLVFRLAGRVSKMLIQSILVEVHDSMGRFWSALFYVYQVVK